MTADANGLRHSQVEVAGSSLHVVEGGDPSARPVLFLHGWPECWSAWREVLTLAAHDVHAIAIDLPGIGGSTGDPTDGTTTALAGVVRGLGEQLDLSGLTLVGQDLGGMVAYPYLRQHRDLAGAIIMDVAIPGVDPWDRVVRNPYIWHFAYHSIPGLPERMTQGRQRDYFDFFYDVLSADPSRIDDAAREEYVAARLRRAADRRILLVPRLSPGCPGQPGVRGRAMLDTAALPARWRRGWRPGGVRRRLRGCRADRRQHRAHRRCRALQHGGAAGRGLGRDRRARVPVSPDP